MDKERVRAYTKSVDLLLGEFVISSGIAATHAHDSSPSEETDSTTEIDRIIKVAERVFSQSEDEQFGPIQSEGGGTFVERDVKVAGIGRVNFFYSSLSPSERGFNIVATYLPANNEVHDRVFNHLGDTAVLVSILRDNGSSNSEGYSSNLRNEAQTMESLESIIFSESEQL